MDIFIVNWWLLPIGVVLNFVVGMIWYSEKVFGKQWMAAAGITQDEAAQGMGVGLIISSVVSAAITTYGIGVLLGAAHIIFVQETVWINMGVAAFLWAVIFAAPYWMHRAFEKKSPRLFCITAIHELIVFLLISILYFLL